MFSTRGREPFHGFRTESCRIFFPPRVFHRGSGTVCDFHTGSGIVSGTQIVKSVPDPLWTRVGLAKRFPTLCGFLDVDARFPAGAVKRFPTLLWKSVAIGNGSRPP